MAESIWRLCILSVTCLCISALWPNSKQNVNVDRIQPNDPRVLNRNAVCPPDCPADCLDVLHSIGGGNGAYVINLATDAMRPVVVYCDMETEGGGWTVLQSRFSGALNFYRNYTEYEVGFGAVTGEFWLGNYDMYLLAAQKRYELRVDVMSFNGNSTMQKYYPFIMGSPIAHYSFGYVNTYGGDGDDCMPGCGTKFSTHDVDSDRSSDTHCAVSHRGGWWYTDCGQSNLNGLYTTNTDPSNFSQTNIFCCQVARCFHVPLRSTSLKIRPL